MKTYDLVIRGGEVVTEAGSVGAVDIGIIGERIAGLGHQLQGTETIDAKGLLVLPGGIDAHVHLSYPGPPSDEPGWVDDFTSGSAAALAGGITTLGNMTFPASQETPMAALERERRLVEAQAIADIFLHPVLRDPGEESLRQLPALVESGVTSLKLFTVFPWFEGRLTEYMRALRRAHALGMITLIHCEDHALIQDATEQLEASGRGNLRYYAESRPVISEVVATQRACAMAEATGAPLYVVHLSSQRALQVCVDAQARGIPIFVETRPLYLHLTRERFLEPDGAKYVGQPPLREDHDVSALWQGIRQGTIHTVCTDHAPWLLAAKLDAGHTLQELRPGVANLETQLPMLYSEGVRTGRISLARLVQVTASNAARIFGIFPRKGTIAVGSDADLVLLDPQRTQVVDRSLLKSRSDYSAFEGWEVTGWPAITLRRGAVVYRDGEVLGKAGSGQLLSRGPTMPV